VVLRPEYKARFLVALKGLILSKAARRALAADALLVPGSLGVVPGLSFGLRDAGLGTLGVGTVPRRFLRDLGRVI
jgi:hypothetical protein